MIEINNILDVEKHLDGIDVVIFDLDDTLYLERDYVRSGFEAIANEYPNVNNLFEELWNAFLDGKQAIDYVLEKECLLSEKDNCLRIYRFHKPKIQLQLGVKEMLLRLKTNKKLGLITDGRVEGQKAKITALGIDKLFDKMIITDELGGIEYRKPNTKAFELMKEYFSSNYQKMCYIGDNLKKDGIAPNELGMSFILFSNKNGLY